MSNNIKLAQTILTNIHKHVYSRKWPCMVPGCNELAINSHLMQKNGVLSTIAEKGHLIEIKASDIFSWNSNDDSGFLEFKMIGLSKALSYPLYCDKHDTVMFKDIESHPINLKGYKEHLLFSHRAICAELRKKERNVDLYQRMLRSVKLQMLGYMNNASDIKITLDGSIKGVEDFGIYKRLIEEELLDCKNQFVFKVFTYPLVELYSSTVFTPLDYSKGEAMSETAYKVVFIHVIPYANQTYVIVGYHKSFVNQWIESYVDSWANLNSQTFQKKLTDLCVIWSENWGMSPKLYNSLDSYKKKLLLNYWEKNANNLSIYQDPGFNLFGRNGIDF